MTFEIYTKFKCKASESIQFAAFAHVLYNDVGKLHCAILYVHFSLSLSMITLRNDFVMYSPIKSNDVLLGRKQDLHN